MNYGSLPHQYQQINIICPYYSRNTRRQVSLGLGNTREVTMTVVQDVELHMIYNVGKDEFDSCSIRTPQPRIIAYCTQPYEKK